jgi:ribosomal protein S18 acetylase RimI-like enzyme
MPLEMRAATSADVDALNALVNSAYRGDSSRAGWTTEADLLGGQRVDPERLTESISASDQVVLVYEVDARIDACVLLQRTGDTSYLGMLTVRPTLQGRRIGTRVIESAELWAREHWSTREMHMTVLVQRPELIAWYERRGYRRRGERKPFPYHDERFGLPRRPDLEFEVLVKTLSGAGANAVRNSPPPLQERD